MHDHVCGENTSTEERHSIKMLEFRSALEKQFWPGLHEKTCTLRQVKSDHNSQLI